MISEGEEDITIFDVPSLLKTDKVAVKVKQFKKKHSKREAKTERPNEAQMTEQRHTVQDFLLFLYFGNCSDLQPDVTIFDVSS